MNMMNNLFSMFDPSTSYYSMAWLMIMVTPIVMANKLFNQSNKKLLMVTSMMLTVNKEIKELTSSLEKKAMSVTMVSMFFTVMVMNMVAILPFNFTITAHMSITLALSLSIWMASMINAIMNSTKNSIIHLTPMGTPNALMNFMVLIELISQLIRPITLAVRLMANMVAGHLLMNLLSNFSLISFNHSTASVIPMVTLIMLETAVALIQAYVITILATLYYKETF